MNFLAMLPPIFIFLIFCAKCESTNLLWPGSVNSVFRGTRLSLQPDVQATLTWAVQIAVENCREEFKWDRWNCPESAFSRRLRKASPTPTGTKESAYVHAIISAAISHAITRNCSRGSISGCGCDPKLIEGSGEGDWVWGGCSESTEFGEEASKKFLDDAETGTDAVAYTNLHNYGVGRETVKSSLWKRCKCHGISGSCTIRSCWMEMSPFTEISHQLKKRYDKAVRVEFERGHGKTVTGNSVIGNTLSMIPKANTKNLIYLQESPNYCLTNNTTGWEGTLGRTCSREHGEGVKLSENKSCRNLCRKCGHSIKKTKRMVLRQCNCTFKWCCEVNCETCKETVVEHYCAKKVKIFN